MHVAGGVAAFQAIALSCGPSPLPSCSLATSANASGAYATPSQQAENHWTYFLWWLRLKSRSLWKRRWRTQMNVMTPVFINIYCITKAMSILCTHRFDKDPSINKYLGENYKIIYIHHNSTWESLQILKNKDQVYNFLPSPSLHPWCYFNCQCCCLTYTWLWGSHIYFLLVLLFILGATFGSTQ